MKTPYRSREASIRTDYPVLEKSRKMLSEVKAIVTKLLEGIHDPKIVKDLCAADVTYVSLHYSNADLHKIMPWCGTGCGVGVIIKTFADVGRFAN